MPSDDEVTFHFVGESEINHMKVLEYLARKSNEPVDRFHVFFANGDWNAWTADCVSETKICIRRAFAASLQDRIKATKQAA